MVYVFTIVGKSEPLFEAELIPPSSGSQPAATSDELAYLHQFVLHASLDMVQSSMWSNNANFLRVIDRFNTLLVSAYITPGGTVMLLLHHGRTNEESIRAFFVEVGDLYAKHVMNPFAVLVRALLKVFFLPHLLLSKKHPHHYYPPQRLTYSRMPQ